MKSHELQVSDRAVASLLTEKGKSIDPFQFESIFGGSLLLAHIEKKSEV